MASEFDDKYHAEVLNHPDDSEFPGIFLKHTLAEVPRRPMLTVQYGSSVAETLEKMIATGVGAALVVQDGHLVGIFTERDVLTRVAGAGVDTRSTPVEKVMTARPDTLPAEASLAYALHKMSHDGYRHIPLVDREGSPYGVVAVRDIVAWIVELFPHAVLNLPPEPQYPLTVEGG